MIVFGNDRDCEESMFLFVWKKATVYLFGEQNCGEIGFSIRRCRIISFVPSDNSLRGMSCQIFLNACFDAFISPERFFVA